MTSEEQSLAPTTKGALVVASGVDALLVTIRPAWQARSLIERVRRLVPVDPSSACQRIFNAAIHDLREKIVIAGVDIAREAAKQNKLRYGTRLCSMTISTLRFLDRRRSPGF